MGSVKFPDGFDAVSDVGSVDRRGLGGLVIFVSDSRFSDVFGGSSRVSGGGEDMSAGGGSARGTIFMNILVNYRELWIEGVDAVSDTSVRLMWGVQKSRKA